MIPSHENLFYFFSFSCYKNTHQSQMKTVFHSHTTHTLKIGKEKKKTKQKISNNLASFTNKN